ncbi:MAG: chemotaxis protein CheC [Xylanivirga thermophila]|jgi:chemotaxis protein CheC|uniref:chemotaxis protein CheC n=1 Tax=Xylanivirga thermophila TaxID=2496273 RepID=UPI00101C8479|nr:chemotaxis protein CheC [Xylanivirga thermophila]
MPFNIDKPSNMYIDILKEVANIGAGSAATSLYQLINKPIGMNVPQVNIIPFNKIETVIGGADTLVAGIYLEFYGDISGTIVFVMDIKSAKNLSRLLLEDMYIENESFSDIEISALQEVGNILAGAYLSALSKLTNLTIKHSVPQLVFDMVGAILSVPMIEFGEMGDTSLFIETDFVEGLKSIKGHFFLIPDIKSYPIMLKSLGVV